MLIDAAAGVQSESQNAREIPLDLGVGDAILSVVTAAPPAKR